ncbi:MAG: DUF429 domain-containing protein [Ktedonobacteraceae bacterium]|nr:DUF429 domain-containing protein [Ktedonobacteraceae bacterium]
MPISLFGIDFTSSPSSRKLITCARCSFSHGVLTVLDCLTLPTFSAFEAFLLQPGPWVAACDFPFGLLSELVKNLGWPESWHDYVSHVASLGKDGFVAVITEYMAGRPAGAKLHLRLADKIAGARSPMMLYRVPVGKMFFEGAPRLLASGASVEPCSPRPDTRVIVEGYPALVARRWLGKRSYKSDDRKKQTDALTLARRDLVAGIRSPELKSVYNMHLSLSNELAAQLIEEQMADRLDAILCAIQAAWAYQWCENPHRYSYSIPPDFASEGWITDPFVLNAYLLDPIR